MWRRLSDEVFFPQHIPFFLLSTAQQKQGAYTDVKVNFKSRLNLKFMFQCFEQSRCFFGELINPITTFASTKTEVYRCRLFLHYILKCLLILSRLNNRQQEQLVILAVKDKENRKQREQQLVLIRIISTSNLCSHMRLSAAMPRRWSHHVGGTCSRNDPHCVHHSL